VTHTHSCVLLVGGTSLSGRSTLLRQAAAAFQAQCKQIPTHGTYILELTVPAATLSARRLRGDVTVRAAPGALYSPALYQELRRDASGVLVVVDSQRELLDTNADWLESHAAWVRAAGREVADVPMAFAYNKRDLPNIHSVETLQARLNGAGAPYRECIATQGVGVIESIKALVALVEQRAP
jgi:hypothetical protein